MNVQSFSQHAARKGRHILSTLLDNMGTHDAVPAGWGLPAGGVHLTGRQLILAGTLRSAPLFQPAMQWAASATGADVVLAHYSLDPENRMPARFTVLVHMSRRPHIFNDMVLYADRALPLEKDGLRTDCEPPFLTFHKRCEGIDAAAAAISCATRVLEAA